MLYTGQTINLKSTDNAKANVLCKQVNVKTAEKLYNAGFKIWLHPCNLTVNNLYQVPYHFQKSETNTACFESLISNFANYNCDKERGKRIIFFSQCVYETETGKLASR